MIKVSRMFKQFSALVLLMMVSASVQAAETMLGSHGGLRDTTWGAISIIDQSNADLVILDVPFPDNDRAVAGIATNSAGRVFGVMGSRGFSDGEGPILIEIDPSTGQMLEEIGRMQTAGGSDCWVSDLSFQPGTDVLYGMLSNQGSNDDEFWCGLPDNVGGHLLTINIQTAVVTVVGRAGQVEDDSNGGIAFAPNGTLYFTPCSFNSPNGVLLTLNPANAAVTSTVNLDNGSCYQGMAIRPSDGTLFVSYDWEGDTNNIVTVNTSTGVTTQVGLTGDEMIHDLTFVDLTFSVGGTVSGLAGSGLVLQNEGGDDLAISANGSFSFSTEFDDGDSYSVTVKTQPTNLSQTCTVSNGSGTVSLGNVTDVTVECVTDSFTVGGSVSGLIGSGLVLQNNSGDDLAITGNGNFTFPTALADGSAYAVTVLTNPSNPEQFCSVSNAGGTLAGANVTNLSVLCATETHTIGGTVSGLSGSGLVLQNNAGDDLPISANGGFTFSIPVPEGGAYSVTVRTQPSGPSQACTVSNGSGTVGVADITDVVVDCVTDTFTVGGSVSGLSGSGLVLQNNGGDNLAISANGSFTFATALLDGSAYSVTVLTHPANPQQSCTVSNGSGNLGGSNVTNVSIVCGTVTFAVGGNVNGLSGSGLILQNNGGDDLAISADGSFAFATELEDGSPYAVTIKVQPASPSQTCAVSNASGTLNGADITNVAVNCVTDTFTVGGTVSGLSGNGLVLQNNGGDDLVISGEGAFTFATALDDGSAYSVTVLTQPSNPVQTCSVIDGSGTLGGADVTGVQVVCSTESFTVGGTVSGLEGSGLVLQVNGLDDLAVSANGGFTFAAALADGSPYTVTVKTQPSGPGQTCSVSNGTGTLSGADVTDVTVTCVIAVVFQINPGLNDAWFNSDTAGQGFFIIVFEQQGIIFMAWFTYDTALPDEDVEAIFGWAGHRWLTAQGPFDGDTAVLEVFLTEGGEFDSEEPTPVTSGPIGTITIVWDDCENGTLTYDIDPPGVMGVIPIRRIVPDNVPLCEALGSE